MLTVDNAAIVADICRRLDGIPLAIELAAARVEDSEPAAAVRAARGTLSAADGGTRDVLRRHQTLRALIDWSHDLLDEAERTLFRRLAIFANGFTLEGAVAVGGGSELDELDVVDVLTSLVDKSLVLSEPAGDAPRLRLLESTRAYAVEKIRAAAEWDSCEARRLRYLRDRFAEVRERYEATARAAELDLALETELADIRAALDHALTGPDARIGAEMLTEIGIGWANAGLESEGLSRAEAFLAAVSQAEPRLLARLWLMVGRLAIHALRTARGFDAVSQAVARARLSGDRALLAESLVLYAWSTAWLRKFDEAQSALAEAEAIPEVSTLVALGLLSTQAFVSMQCGDLAAAARAFERHRDAHRSLGNASNAARAGLYLAEVEHARGDTSAAIAIIRDLLPWYREHGDRTSFGDALVNLAEYLAAVDDPAGAYAAARDAIRELAGEPANTGVAVAVELMALALALSGNISRAAALAAYADAALRNHGFERNDTTTHDRLMTILRDRLAPAEFARKNAEGGALAPEAAIALALEDLGAGAPDAGSPEDARRSA